VAKRTELRTLSENTLDALAKQLILIRKIQNSMASVKLKDTEDIKDFQERMAILSGDLAKISNAIKGMSHERRQVEEKYREAAKKLSIDEKLDVMFDFYGTISKNKRKEFFRRLMAPMNSADRRELALNLIEIAQKIDKDQAKYGNHGHAYVPDKEADEGPESLDSGKGEQRTQDPEGGEHG
jgi:hypothetical protein